MRKIRKIRICAIGLCIFLVAGVFSTEANGFNQPPVAIDDNYFMDINEMSKKLPILDNDYDPDDFEVELDPDDPGETDPGSITIVQKPTQGTIVVDKTTGVVTYTINKGNSKKMDNFTYYVCDIFGLKSNIATVAITVNQIEEEPPTSTVTSRAGKSRSRIRNHPPIADASAGEPYYGYINEEITFDGSLSHDPDGAIISYLWNFNDVTFGNTEIVKNTFSSPKTSLVTLTVMDDKGAKDTYITTVSISQPNRPPSDPDIYGPETCIMGTKYSYAALSKDSDGDNIKYVFDWGDNNTDESEFLSLQRSHGVSFIHSWSSAGNYTLIVTVSDNQTLSSSEISVVVIEPSYDYLAIIILGIIIAFFLILSLILVKTGKISKLRKK